VEAPKTIARTQTRHKHRRRKPKKKRTQENHGSLACVKVGVEGLEQPLKTREKLPAGEKLTPNAPLSITVDVDLRRLIETWPMLDDAVKQSIMRLIDEQANG
jgi:hypothetical protein